MAPTSSDLVKKLRAEARAWREQVGEMPLFDRAADRIEELEARIEEALESLNENEDPDTVVIGILSAALSDVKEEEK